MYHRRCLPRGPAGCHRSTLRRRRSIHRRKYRASDRCSPWAWKSSAAMYSLAGLRALLPRSARHDLAHVHAVDRLIDVLAGALETTPPIVGVPQHPGPARLVVVLPFLIEEFAVRVDEPRHPLLHLSQNDLRRRKDEEARGLARELQHSIV